MNDSFKTHTLHIAIITLIPSVATTDKRFVMSGQARAVMGNKSDKAVLVGEKRVM